MNRHSRILEHHITTTATKSVLAWGVWLALACAVCGGLVRAEEPTGAGTEPRLRAIFAGAAPETVEDLKAMQQHVQSLTENVLPATVGVQVGAAQGSGVIVSADGYVLTAAHVISKSGLRAQIYLGDGRRVGARTLGTFRTNDAGLLKIEASPDDPNVEWPHVKMSDTRQLAPGQWCLALGHPGGIQEGRHPSVRLGRVLSVHSEAALSTDCTLIGGDSGGPLFDMRGEVVGIHSRIGGPLTANLHIPIQTFRDAWGRLARGDNWGHPPGSQPYLGVQGESDGAVARLKRVFPKSPAEKAGLLADDIVLALAGEPIASFGELRQRVDDLEPGSKVAIEIQRGNQRLTLELVIGRIRE